MATALSLSFSLDPQNRFNTITTTKTTRRFTFSTLPHRKTLIPNHFKLSSSSHSQFQTLIPNHFKLSSSSHSQFQTLIPNHFKLSSSSHSQFQTLIPNHFKLSSSSHSQFQTLIQPGKFLTNDELEKLQFLSSFLYSHQLQSGTVWVRVMRDSEVDAIVCLLADSFAESMMFMKGYINVLRFLVKQYLIERRSSMPHMATLVGFYRGLIDGEDEEMQLAGTVEISFDKNGANATLPSPTPPRDSPYICNMAVEKSLRR